MKRTVLSDDAVRSRLKELSFQSLGIATCDDGICLGRHGNANWLSGLEDLLEDIGISAENFAAASRSPEASASATFTVERGRLRLVIESLSRGYVTIDTLATCIGIAQSA